MNWLYLATAILGEVMATSALKSSEGFERLVPSLIVASGYTVAFYFGIFFIMVGVVILNLFSSSTNH
jgi:multidrug transporter EmrE-like cation transporter